MAFRFRDVHVHVAIAPAEVFDLRAEANSYSDT